MEHESWSADSHRAPDKGGTVDRKQHQLLEQGLAAFYREDEETALDIFLDVIRQEPGNLRAYYLATLTAALLSDEETLEFVYERVRLNRSRHPYVLACEACRYLFLANFSRAEELFKAALQSLPRDVDLHIGLACLYLLAGEEERSTGVYSRVLELEPDNVRALIALGMAYAMEGEYSNALMEYQRAKELDPDAENPHQRLGRDYYTAGLFAEAASEFAVATSEEPDQPAAWFYLLDCYTRQGRIDDALDVYASIKSRFRSQPEVTSGLFEYFHMTSDAIAALEELARRNPGAADVQFRLSQAYLEAGRRDDALRAAEAAVRLEKDETEPLVWLARLYHAEGRYTEAIAMCDQAIAKSPTEQMAYQVKSDALIFLGRGEESQQVYEEMERVRDRAWQE
ncbi:MAG: tetratricopeptide repeat protein, partial [candidate division WOR-3 bacterium]